MSAFRLSRDHYDAAAEAFVAAYSQLPKHISENPAALVEAGSEAVANFHTARSESLAMDEMVRNAKRVTYLDDQDPSFYLTAPLYLTDWTFEKMNMFWRETARSAGYDCTEDRWIHAEGRSVLGLAALLHDSGATLTTPRSLDEFEDCRHAVSPESPMWAVRNP